MSLKLWTGLLSLALQLGQPGAFAASAETRAPLPGPATSQSETAAQKSDAPAPHSAVATKPGTSTSKSPALSAEEALNELLAGNLRCIQNQLNHHGRDLERIYEVSKAQHPIAAILGCSDSRVAPEILFDQGLGDLFVVRNAGNIVDDVALGSLEYAVDSLEVPLIVVLGHSRCGAVKAAITGHHEGHMLSFVDTISPSVRKMQGRKGDQVDLVVRENVRRMVQQLEKQKPILAERVRQGKVKIVGAYYDLDSGKVKIIEI